MSEVTGGARIGLFRLNMALWRKLFYGHTKISTYSEDGAGYDKAANKCSWEEAYYNWLHRIEDQFESSLKNSFLIGKNEKQTGEFMPFRRGNGVSYNTSIYFVKSAHQRTTDFRFLTARVPEKLTESAD